jgi:predicted ArsR family transcriptional regulator
LIGETSQQIVNELKKNGMQSVQELVHTVGYTDMAIRHHLQTLETSGDITSKYVKSNNGRRTKVYMLTEKGESRFQKDYIPFLVNMIQDMKGNKEDTFLMEIVRRYQDRLYFSIDIALSYKDQVNTQSFIDVMNDRGCMMEHEQKGEIFILHQHNCPLQEVAKYLPEICEAERQTYEKLLNVDHLELVSNGNVDGKSCTFCYKSINLSQD